MALRIVTTGVYGFTEEEFFKALQDAGVDTFCDVRFRRGMRGSLYAFANSARLQRKLDSLGIRYLHLKELAPPQSIRDLQSRDDKLAGNGKRSRQKLGSAFIQAYKEQCLSSLDSARFIEMVGPDAGLVCLFCVEGKPEACHRSLLAERLASDLGVEVSHILPPG